MDTFRKDFLKDLREKRKTYADMVEFCADSMILNNSILLELNKRGFYFDTFCGDAFEYYDENGNYITREEYEKQIDEGKDAREEPRDIYQYFIISYADAERFAEYTNEFIIFCDDLDLYLLCVDHFGTPWQGVAANWKNPNDEEDEEDEDDEEEQDEEQDDDEGGRE